MTGRPHCPRPARCHRDSVTVSNLRVMDLFGPFYAVSLLVISGVGAVGHRRTNRESSAEELRTICVPTANIKRTGTREIL